MANIQLKVSPEVLHAKAQEISGQIHTIENNWRRMYDLIQNSKSYWQGEASENHRKYLKENDEETNKLLKRLREHPIDLQKMAGVYVEAEQKAVQIASALPDDVIS
ncbi:MAG: hypothetical protein HFI84_01565 [Eubacterium sp.]|nr:hypothetical protein [Eubacterium sp.]